MVELKESKLKFIGVSGFVSYLLVGLLVVAAFLIGSLYTKVQYLEKGSVSSATETNIPSQVSPGAVKSKYASLDDAMKDLANGVKLNGNKIVTCMNSGEKSAQVQKDQQEGEAIGVQGTPAFYINGRFFGGAFPLSIFKEVIDKELNGTGSDEVTDYSQTLQTYSQRGAFNPKAVKITLGDAPVVGASNAKVTIVEYSDFQCPFCSQVEPTLKQILSEYEGKVKLAYKHFPLQSIHPHAQKTAEASECAKDQGKFWEFHQALFSSQSDWSNI